MGKSSSRKYPERRTHEAVGLTCLWRIRSYYLHTFLVYIKEIYIELIDRRLDHAKQVRLESKPAAGIGGFRVNFLVSKS
jgi:hypothetical protein